MLYSKMIYIYICKTISLYVKLTVNCLPTMQETWVRSLGWKILWRRKWEPTPVLLPGRSHGRRRVVDYSPWGRKESDTTERPHFHFNAYVYI